MSNRTHFPLRRMLVVLGCWLAFCMLAVVPELALRARGQPRQTEFRVLVFSKTAGFRHESIPVAVNAVKKLGTDNNFEVVATEDASVFTDAGLAPYDAVVFLMTTGDVLNSSQQAAFERYIRAGNGYAGIHSASDTEFDWPWYGGLVGAYFKDHPSIQTASITVENRLHPSTSMLTDTWRRRDEWYNFQTNPRGTVQVLLELNEASYSGGTMGDHPIAWYRAYDGGRSWYTGGGHTNESYAEPLFLAHILGGIRYAADVASAEPTTTTTTTTTTPATSTSATSTSTSATSTSTSATATTATSTSATATSSATTSPPPRPPRAWLPLLRR